MSPRLKCNPKTGYHIVRPGEERCACGERGRMNTPQETSPTSAPAPDPSLEPTVVGCGRCGGDHRVRFKPLTRPIELEPGVAAYTLTHWAVCPTTGEPILMRLDASQD